ncbi:MAG: Gfo/Idh/MocA family protein [Vicinamibacterales bacterium]
MKTVRWGVLGVAKIATVKVVPAMQQGQFSTVTAIASRDPERARQAAQALGIAKSYGSYDALLDDPDIDAVYNPLPNHLHVPWSIRAAERGKHVLCEKPIALSADEARQLLAVRDRTGVKMQEAFMVRTHPQWLKARALVRDGHIGELRGMLGAFSYFNDDPANIRNMPEIGGGALMDVGCYLVNTSRFIFDGEPRRVVAAVDRDPAMRTDRVTSLILDYGSAHLVGTCSTQMVPYQQVQIFGTRGRIEIRIPFNAPPDRPCEVFLDSGADLFGGGQTRIEVPACNQYTIQGDLFSQAILTNGAVPEPLEDAVRNMEWIEAAFRSAETGAWASP